MKVALFALMVKRSMDAHIKVVVPRHEAELLRAVHGAEGVQLIAAEPVGEMVIGAVFEERDRLHAKYGMKNADTAWADHVYPTDKVLADTIAEGEIQEDAGPKRGRRAADAPAV